MAPEMAHKQFSNEEINMMIQEKDNGVREGVKTGLFYLFLNLLFFMCWNSFLYSNNTWVDVFLISLHFLFMEISILFVSYMLLCVICL